MTCDIFVFASNLAGLHHGGSAREAVEKHGAEMGCAVGLTGNSYAIPTLDQDFEQLPLDVIRGYVDGFLKFAKANRDMRFKIVAIGCGIAGFRPEQIAPMFENAPNNCVLPLEFILTGTGEKE